MATFKSSSRDDLREAMRAKQRERVGALRLLLSELQKAAKDGSDDELAVLRRERKRRLEAARAYREAGRDGPRRGRGGRGPDLIAGYLPAELSDEELVAIVQTGRPRQRVRSRSRTWGRP